MPTVTLNLRDGDRIPEDVDLDALTPKARALALAVAAQTFRNRVLIHVMNTATGETRPWRGWAKHFPAHSTLTPAGYLEIEARKFPPEWQIPVQDHTRPAAQWAVDHADDLVNRSTALDRLRTKGITPTIDEFCRRTAHGDMPRPARYVETGQSSMPLWSAAELDAWAREQVVTASEAAEILGVAHGRIARQQLDRWGVRSVGRAPGRGGESLYATPEVREALANRPGRGARADLARG